MRSGVERLRGGGAGLDLGAIAFTDSVANDIDEPGRHGGSAAAVGEQGWRKDAGRVASAPSDELACEVVEEARGEQIVREHGPTAAAPTLLDEVFQQHSPTGKEPDLNGTFELCGQQPAHLTARLVRPLVARSRRGKDHFVAFAQRREAVGENSCKPGVGPESRGETNVATGGSGPTDRLGEVDMDVIPRREQQRREDDRTIVRQSGDHLVDIGLLDIHMTEHHLVCEPTDAQISSNLCRKHLDEDLARG